MGFRGGFLRGVPLCIFLACASYSASAGVVSKLYAEAGAFFAAPGYVATDELGNTSLVDPVTAALGSRARFDLFPDWNLESALRFVLPWRRNIDGNQRVFTTLIYVDSSHDFTDWLRGRLGVAFQWQFISGPSGSVTQRNGTTSQTFFVPEASTSMWIGGLTLGGNYLFWQSAEAFVEATIWEFLSSERRRTSVTLGVSYAFF